ncbi:hypothetical protein [Mariniblastus fucicola]|uniref:hypothetical protein n=1 Tax=Mariniblastus fucicola TaxID=980251 RepID=UPI001EE3A63D|nr:hypothetical protein [Mariniblastus fucicola]
MVEVTSQLSPDSQENQIPAVQMPQKPQVVFVDRELGRTQQIIEIKVDPDQLASLVAANQGSSQTDSTSVFGQPVGENVNDPGGQASASSHPPFRVDLPIGEVEPSTAEARFAVDPFVYEVDGAIPVMPSLPIVAAQQMTEEVVARKSAGDHYAWRLMPGPYPAVGNMPMVDAASADQPNQDAITETPNSPHPSAPASTTGSVTRNTVAEPWTESEVVVEADRGQSGECFFAQAGDVISIDGNQGFDHIDLRSYSIDDATFQRGAILLHAGLEPAESGEGEQASAPITIRHRGVGFAIFSGEVRVEL